MLLNKGIHESKKQKKVYLHLFTQMSYVFFLIDAVAFRNHRLKVQCKLLTYILSVS